MPDYMHLDAELNQPARLAVHWPGESNSICGMEIQAVAGGHPDVVKNC